MFDLFHHNKKHIAPLGGSPFAQDLLELLEPHLEACGKANGLHPTLEIYHGPRLAWKNRFDIPIDPRDIYTHRQWKDYKREMAKVVDAESFEAYRSTTLSVVQNGDDLPILADMLCQTAKHRPGGVVRVAFGLTQWGEDFGIPCVVVLW